MKQRFQLTPRLRLPVALMVLAAAGALISACAGSRPEATDEAVAARLRAEVRRWQGTPHRWGGSDPKGIDCSGFVQTIYADLFEIELPRSTAAQVRVGKGVAADALRPGDLLFFRPPAKYRHVGIYLGGGQFAHAGTSSGVTVSHLGDPYWRECFWTARRVL